MTKTTKSLVPVLAMVMLFASCSKEMDNAALAPVATASSETVNASVVSGNSYTLSFDQTATVSVHKQAVHFQVSGTKLNSETGKVIYTYSPAAGYTGDDEVTLAKVQTFSHSSSGGCSSNRSENGGSTSSSISYVTVKIKVTQ